MLDKTVERWKRELRDEWREEERQQGRQQGLKEGLKEGREEGVRKGMAKVLLHVLERKFGPVDPRTRARIRRAGSDRLLEWLDRVLTAERLEQVFDS